MGLEPNKKYTFRVRAENQYGVSEPLTMDDSITAKVIKLSYFFEKLFHIEKRYTVNVINVIFIETLY